MGRRGTTGLGLGTVIAVVALCAPTAGYAQSIDAEDPFKARGMDGPTPQFDTKAASGWKARVGSSINGQVFVSFQKKQLQTGYSTSGTNDFDVIQATFPSFGSVDMSFDPKGKKKKLKLPRGCTGKPDKVQKGSWKGTFTFATNFTSVDITKAKGRVFYPGDYLCRPRPLPTPKASLLASNGGGDTSFGAFRLKGKRAPTTFSANRFYSIDGVSVSELAFAKGKTSEFKYDFGDETATASPPSPFKGTGNYDQGLWTGDLSVKFATGSVGLISGFSATLVKPN